MALWPQAFVDGSVDDDFRPCKTAMNQSLVTPLGMAGVLARDRANPGETPLRIGLGQARLCSEGSTSE